MIQRKLSK